MKKKKSRDLKIFGEFYKNGQKKKKFSEISEKSEIGPSDFPCANERSETTTFQKCQNGVIYVGDT